MRVPLYHSAPALGFALVSFLVLEFREEEKPPGRQGAPGLGGFCGKSKSLASAGALAVLFGVSSFWQEALKCSWPASTNEPARRPGGGPGGRAAKSGFTETPPSPSHQTALPG